MHHRKRLPAKKRRIAVSKLVCLALGWLALRSAAGQSAPDFGAMRAQNQVGAIRAHAWTIVAEITPDWQTWPTKGNLLRGDAKETIPDLRPARQLTPDFGMVGSALGPVVTPVMALHYNEDLFNELVQLDPLHVDLHARYGDGKDALPCFPSSSIAVKAVWWPARPGAWTALPVWDDRPAIRADGKLDGAGFANSFMTWSRLVAVGDAGPMDADSYVDLNFVDPANSGRRCVRSARCVSRSSFFTGSLAPKGSPAHGALSDIARALWPETGLQETDEMILVGLHFMKNETEDWFWGTLWWHDRARELEPQSARPAGLDCRWENYRLAVTIDDDSITYNPWLEAPMAEGVTSNCRACHGRAATQGRPRLRGGVEASYWKGRTGARSLWSIVR